MILDKERQFLQSITALFNGSFGGVKALLKDPRILDLAKQYEENRGRRVVDVGFNLFVLISDIYHRENFHSDVLKLILDPASEHKEGDKYLRLFIEYLNATRPSLCINPQDYTDAKVFREQGRVDLLIQGSGAESHAIVVENKMNDAPDMPRQIPRYVEYVKELGCTCDAIIYLRLSRARYPDTTGWTPEEQTEIYAKLACITGYADLPDDLVNGWINQCSKVSEHEDTRLILGQYGTLIQKLGGEIMNKPVMKEFYTLMLDADNFKAAQSLSSMWKDLVLYRVEAIIEEFRSDVAPFKKINNWKDGDAYFTGLMWKSAHLGIDIVVEPDGYKLSLWDRNDDETTNETVKQAMDEIGCGKKYPVKEGRFSKRFEFPSQQQDLIEFVRALKQDLKMLNHGGK